jgi:peptidoglycan hydrolase CwlO-like protein
MARKQSVILTPAEKKAAVGTAKDAVKNAKAKLAEVNKARKALDSEYTKAVKASDKDIAAAQKAVTAAEAGPNQGRGSVRRPPPWRLCARP